MKNFKIIIIIDDNIQENRPLIVQIKEKYGAENVKLFNKKDGDGTPIEGLNYILNKENLKYPTVLLLDIDLGSNSINGFDIVKRVRKETALLQIIMMSAHAQILNKVSYGEWIELINNQAMAFLDATTDIKTKIDYIEKAKHQMETRIDCVLEDWIAELDEEERSKPIYASRQGRQWTFNDILREIRERTDEGTDIEKNIITLTLDLITRGKRTINA